MSEGFLGFQASFMLDVVVCALMLVVPVQVFSLYQVKARANFALHKRLQLGLAAALVLAVGGFEVDMQLVHGGWENVVNKNPESPRRSPEEIESIRSLLYGHLFFAVTTPILWGATIALALARFPSPPVPSPHSPLHKKLGWLSTIDLMLTSATGLWFYYAAFVAE